MASFSLESTLLAHSSFQIPGNSKRNQVCFLNSEPESQTPLETPVLETIRINDKHTRAVSDQTGIKQKPAFQLMMNPFDQFATIAGSLFTSTLSETQLQPKQQELGIYDRQEEEEAKEHPAPLNLSLTTDGMYRTRSMSFSGFMSPRVESVLTESFDDSMTMSRATSQTSETIERIQVQNSQHRLNKRTSTILNGTQNNEETEILDKLPPLNSKIVPPTIQTTAEGEQLALVFCQMVGQLSVDGNYIRESQLEQLQQKVVYNAPGMSGQNHLVKGGGTLGYNTKVNDKKTQQSYPILNTPPTILLVNENLKRGESKSYKYEIRLPSILPPSHRGKVCRIIYKLYIGIQRDPFSKRTKILSIPFRLFNRTDPDGSHPVYEVMSPVVYSRDEAQVNPITGETPLASPLFDLPASAVTPSPHDSRNNSRRPSMQQITEDYETKSFDNVVNVIEVSNRVFYDICKNKEHIAHLNMQRSSYRLGDSVMLVLNFSKSTVPCYHVSVYLESSEVVDNAYALRSKPQVLYHTRVCYGSVHQNTLNTKRLALQLPIPQNATPDFQSTAISMQWYIRLEFITCLQSKPFKGQQIAEGFMNHHLNDRIEAEPFDCTIPIKVYGSQRMMKSTFKDYSFDID
ncbi:Rgp1-domain-containing protein [Gorgonomyces haynaldii]|nr:Rgp1-domain-containing protein [Gorgonomyces haynaldii]